MLRKCNHEKNSNHVNIDKSISWFLKENCQFDCLFLQLNFKRSSEVKNIIWDLLFSSEWEKYQRRMHWNSQKKQQTSDCSFADIQLLSIHDDRECTVKTELKMKVEFLSSYWLYCWLWFHQHFQNMNSLQKCCYLYLQCYFWWANLLWWKVWRSIFTDDCWNE